MRRSLLAVPTLLTACLVGDPAAPRGQSDTAPSSNNPRGIDYAWSRPTSSQALASAGYTFAARYLSYDTTGKNLTAGEAADLHAAGIDVVANWEWGAQDDALDSSRATGVQQAQQALALANQIGNPADRPIYFSDDFDAAESQQPAIDAYFVGFASVLGAQRVGEYAGFWVVKRLFDDGKIAWGWQTTAWSGGNWDPRAQLRQIQNHGVTVAGADCDIDVATAADFGQWGPGETTTTTTVAEGSQAFVTPNQQHYFARLPTGDLRHAFWDGNAQSVQHDTWGTGLAGEPVTFVAGGDQHAFARGGDGSLQHWYYDPSAGLQHATWATGLAGDPAAITIGAYQDVWAVDTGGNLQHWYWGADTSGIAHDTWGSGVTGRPSVLVDGTDQHVFVRGTSGTLEHFWWSPASGVQHDTWGSGLAGDPAALLVDNQFQDVWAVDTAGALQHWFWGPSTNGIQHDTWATSGAAGRPSVFQSGTQQHVFARGPSGTVEHWFWDPSTKVAHDTWGSGIASDPTAELIGQQQHVWAQDSAGDVHHWYWDPATDPITADDWGN